MTKQNKVKN